MKFAVQNLPFLIFLLFSGMGFGQQLPPSKLESALKLSVKGSSAASRVDALINLGTYYINISGAKAADIATARKYAQQALRISSAAQLKHGEAESKVLLSKVYRESGDEKMGLQYASEALQYLNNPLSQSIPEAYLEMANYFGIQDKKSLRKKIDFQQKGVDALLRYSLDTRKTADALKFLGDLYINYPENDQALNKLNRSLELYKRTGEQNLQEIHSLIATALINKGEIREGLRHHLKAAQLVKELGDRSAVGAMVVNRLAIAYSILDDHHNALKYFRQAQLIAEKNRDFAGSVAISSSIIGEQICLDRIDDAKQTIRQVNANHGELAKENLNLTLRILSLYTKSGEIELGHVYLNRILAKLKNSDLKNRETQICYISVVKYLQGAGNFDLADSYLGLLMAIPDQQVSLENRIAIEQIAVRMDTVKGNFQSAVARQQTLFNLEKNVLKQNTDEQIIKLDVEFETKKKDRELANDKNDVKLLTQRNDMQLENITAQRRVRNLSAAGAALLALLLGISYNQYNIKTKANHALSVQKEAIDSQNSYLRELVTEREWLLKEVHHRVKHNLQIVISLLNSQSVYLKDPAMLEVLRESQNRMNSISLIHQKLYQQDNFSGVYMPNYIRELVQYLRTSFAINELINFEVTVAPIVLDVSQAVPLGLILNEAITNSIKYAFNGRSTGKITIHLDELTSGRINVKIADNGVGFRPDIKADDLTSLGMSLMQGLSAQLGATLVIDSSDGVQVNLNWRRAKILKEENGNAISDKQAL